MEEDLRKKAELILGGDVRVPKDFVFPFRLSMSTAGPGAGKSSVALEFNGLRVKKGISFDSGEFELHDDLCSNGKGKLRMTRNGEPFIDELKIIPIVYHSPNHAFFNLDQRCMFRCLFCASPLLDRNVTKDLTNEKILDMMAARPTDSVALTSGVVGSVQETVDRMVSCVRAIRSRYPDITIGVEPYIDSKEQIDALKAAGADEMKINRETPNGDIFKKVCPDLDYDHVLNMLAHSVKVFGRGRVTSNVIYGMGESDDDLREEMERLASIGCIPGLRAVKLTATNRSQLESALGPLEPVTPERMISLANMQKDIMIEHGLITDTFRTMCFECKCCDIVPFKDL